MRLAGFLALGAGTACRRLTVSEGRRKGQNNVVLDKSCVGWTVLCGLMVLFPVQVRGESLGSQRLFRDPPLGIENCDHVAVAYDAIRIHYAWAHGATLNEAESKAHDGCGADCEIIVWARYGGCVALAISPSGSWGASRRSTPQRCHTGSFNPVQQSGGGLRSSNWRMLMRRLSPMAVVSFFGELSDRRDWCLREDSTSCRNSLIGGKRAG